MKGNGIRCAVVGVGSLGQHHARIYAQLPGTELVGVADVDPQQRETVASRWNTEGFADWRDLLGRVEAVSIAAPTSLHHEIGREFLRQGCHVLMEKPIAAGLKQALELVSLARDSGSILQVGHLERFNPAVRAVRSRIRSPRFVECHRLGPFAPRVTDVSVVLDLMIHDLDLVLAWWGREPLRFEAQGSPVLSDRIDLASARLVFDDGTAANLTASRVSHQPLRKIRIFNDREYLSIDTRERSVRGWSCCFEEPDSARGSMDALQPLSVEVEEAEPLLLELQAFVEAVRTGTSPPVSGEEGCRALRLALQIESRIRENRRKWSETAT